jgi:hypothetical protein
MIMNNNPQRSPRARLSDIYCSTVRRSGQKLYAIIKNGWDAAGERHTDWIPIPQAEHHRARAWGDEYAAQLAKTKAAVNPASAKPPATGPADLATGDWTFRTALDRVYADASAGGGKDADNAKVGYDLICRLMPGPRQAVHPSRITPKELKNNLRNPVADNPDQTKSTKSQYLSQMRRLLAAMKPYGLPGECVKALLAPTGMIGKKPDGYPFTEHDVHCMELRIAGRDSLEQAEPATLHGLYYFEACSALHLGDVTFIRWEDVDEALEAFCDGRIKTEVPFRFMASERLKKWLWQRRREGEVYVFPELVFGVREQKHPDCNRKPLAKRKEKSRHNAVTGRAREYFDPFLKRCKIKRKGISYKSFRHYNISYWKSTGTPDEVGMAIAGQLSYEAYVNYAAPAWVLIGRAKASLEQHYENVGNGTPEHHYLTLTEATRAMQRELLRLEQTLRQEFQGASKDSQQTLELVLHKLGVRRQKMAAYERPLFDRTHFDFIMNDNLEWQYRVKPEYAALYENLGGN